MASSRDSRSEKILSIDQLLRSRWAQLASDPQLRRKIPSMLRKLLEVIPSSHPVVKRIRTALQLFEKESAGELVNSRNLIILSAALLYTFWPADAIPDLLPIVGWMDDVGLLTLVLTSLASSFRKDESPADQEPEPEKELPAPSPAEEEARRLLEQQHKKSSER